MDIMDGERELLPTLWAEQFDGEMIRHRHGSVWHLGMTGGL